MSQEDRAQELELAQWEAVNVNRPRLPTYSPGEPGYGPAFCVVCDEDMPAARRRMGATRCVICQERAERIAPNRLAR